MNRPLGLAPFAGESRLDCGLVAAGGVVAFAAGYLATALLIGGLGVLDHGGDRTARRLAGAGGSVLCWSYFALAFTRARGGPVLNAVVYPVATAVLAPFALRWALFGPDWAGLRDRVGFFLFRPDLLLDAAALLVPGALTFLSLLSAWGATLSDDEIDAWQREHLREEFYDAFVEASDLDGE